MSSHPHQPTGAAASHFAALLAKVDAFFDRVLARHAAAMQCQRGCSDCCHQRLTVTAIEAAHIQAAIAARPAGVRATLARQAAAAPLDRCAALDDRGQCAIYEARPLVCRSHGVPVRQRHDGRHHLAVIEVCPHNFSDTPDLAALESDCILDQTTLSTVLLAIDSAFAREHGLTPGTRLALADLLREPPPDD
jgi:Fe-S-cluster containining protein